MKAIIILFWATPLLLLLSACLEAAAIESIELVQAYEAAHNNDNVEATMAMFAEDAVFELVGQGTLSDLEAIRAIHDYDKGIQARLSFENCVADGLTVTCEAREQNKWLAAAGLEEIFYPSSVFTFNETGRIEKIMATVAPEDGTAMGAVLAEFVPWLMAERPSEFEQLFTPDGQFIYSENSGLMVVDLLQQWQAETVCP